MSKEEVLAYWFGPPGSGARVQFWFNGGPEVDAEIRARFGTEVERAIGGELDAWAERIDGRLALVLLLDQLTRSVYRGDPRTWSGDARAQRLSVEAFERKLHRELDSLGQTFLLMPLAHAEHLELQELAVIEARRIYDESVEGLRPFLARGLEQTTKYRDVIARFGRFPHRNAVLGRPSTAEELAFLATWRQAPSAG